MEPPDPEEEGQDSQAAGSLAELHRLTDRALAHLSLEDLLAELLNRIADILGTDTAAILLLEEDGQTLRARAAKGIEEEVEQLVRIPLRRGFAGRVAAERRAIAIPDVDRADIFNPILRAKGIRSLLGVPLLVEGQVIGVLHVGTLTPRAFSDEHRHLLQVAADRAALAIEHARLGEQRRVAEALQSVIMPVVLPEIPGMRFAARYRPATVGARVGGDWYDIFELSRGLIALAIGDVMGRGVAAAALMAQLRTALRAYAIEGHPPAGVVERLNRLLAGLDGPRMTTLAYAVIDAEQENVRLASAGHIPPLMISPDGDARFLDVTGDVPLGVSQSFAYREHGFDMPAGSTLLLVTDGALEVPGESLDEGLGRLQTLGSRLGDVDTLCDALAGGAAGSPARSDDLAVLAARVEPLPAVLRTSWRADPEVLAPMRHLLRRWLLKSGASEDEAYDITVAVQEACANAIEHAYAPGRGSLELEAQLHDATVAVTVRDRGSWRPPRGTHRGRGLPLMNALVDAVELDRGEDGTIVTLRRRLAA